MRRAGLLVVLALAGCKREESWPGLVETSTLPVGDEDCPQGGTRIDAGLDDGDPSGTAGDGELQDGEIDSTTTECDGLTAHAMLATITELDPGDASCPFGGHRVDYGHDDGDPSGTADNAVLEAGEIEDDVEVCYDAADGLLVVKSPIAYGDDDCPTGGRRVDYGIDDGLPSGTANDGVLDAAEIVGTDKVCDVAIEDAFAPLVPGTTGTEAITVRGGAGVDGGSGGSIDVRVFGGALDTALVARQDDALQIAILTPSPAIDLGANGFQVTTNTAITVWDGSGGEPAGLHLRESESEPRFVYAGSAVVTGLHVAPGVTLTTPVAYVTEIQFDADVHNEGTIVVPESAPDEVGVWVVHCDDFVNGADALVDLRADGSSGQLTVYALAGPDSSIVNLGRLRVNSENQPSPGSAGRMSLVANGAIVNTGNLYVRGGTSGNASASGASGGSLLLLATSGVIENSGTIHAQGGNGSSGGAGGLVTIASGIPHDAVGEYSDVGGNELEQMVFGSGGFVQTGAIDAYGGNGSTEGGAGGYAIFDVRGGDMLVGGSIGVAGGNGTTGTGGIGGNIEALVSAVVADDMLLRPEQVGVQATLDASGGDGASGATGGFVELLVDATMTLPDGYGFALNRTPWSLGSLYGQGVLTVTLAGLGGGIDVGAGDGDGGIGGEVLFGGATCAGGDPACIVPHVGARWLYNDVDIHGKGAPGGYGGSGVEFFVEDFPNRLHAVTDGTRVENHGTFDLAGPDATSGQGAGSAEVRLEADSGDVVNTTPLSLTGGDGPAGGGGGGNVHLAGYTIDQQGDIDTSAGSGGDLGQYAGWIDVYGATVSIDGDLIAVGGSPTDDSEIQVGQGGEVTIAAVDLTVAGDIVSRSGGADGGDVGEGGIPGRVRIAADTASLTGTIDASAGDVDSAVSCEPATGGTIEITALTSLAIDGTVAARGGSCDASGAAEAGSGGYVAIAAPLLAGVATVDVRTGSAVGTTSAVVFYGGQVDIGGDSPYAVLCEGGDATATLAANGGSAGGVTITGANSGDITCTGGDATGATPTGGYGGSVEIGGDNTGCIDVSGGSPDGGAGTVDISGTDAGGC